MSFLLSSWSCFKQRPKDSPWIKSNPAVCMLCFTLIILLSLWNFLTKQTLYFSSLIKIPHQLFCSVREKLQHSLCLNCSCCWILWLTSSYMVNSHYAIHMLWCHWSAAVIKAQIGFCASNIILFLFFNSELLQVLCKSHFYLAIESSSVIWGN